MSLRDDWFLRAHWILFFGYDKDDADPLTRFLLNRHFTPERLDKGFLTLSDVQAYADSLQITARMWLVAISRITNGWAMRSAR